MSEKPSKAHAASLVCYDRLVATRPNVARRGATVPFTSLNGHMFSYLGKGGELALRLPDGEREAFLKKYRTTVCTQYGIVQKEYVSVPDALLAKTAELAPYFEMSLAYAASLKPKAAGKGAGRRPPGTRP